MTNGEMFKEVFGYDLYCKECRDGWRNYEYKGSVHYHFDPEKGRYINDNPPFIPLSVIEKIHDAIDNAECDARLEDENGSYTEEVFTREHIHEIIDKAVKEIEHE